MVSRTMYNGGRRTQNIPRKKKNAPLQVIAFKNGKYSSEVQIPHNCSKKYSTLYLSAIAIVQTPSTDFSTIG